MQSGTQGDGDQRSDGRATWPARRPGSSRRAERQRWASRPRRSAAGSHRPATASRGRVARLPHRGDNIRETRITGRAGSGCNACRLRRRAGRRQLTHIGLVGRITRGVHLHLPAQGVEFRRVGQPARDRAGPAANAARPAAAGPQPSVRARFFEPGEPHSVTAGEASGRGSNCWPTSADPLPRFRRTCSAAGKQGKQVRQGRRSGR